LITAGQVYSTEPLFHCRKYHEQGSYSGSGFVAYPKIPPFIVTLAGMLLFRGLTYIVTNVNPVNPIDDIYSYITTGCVCRVEEAFSPSINFSFSIN
jgi:ABC-type xylose transport system permease subunit